MTIRLNPHAEKSASISISHGERKCTIAPAENADSASAEFHLQRGETCKMTNTGAGRAYVYVQVSGDVEVVIGSKTDKLRPDGSNPPEFCGPTSQQYALPQNVEVEFRAV